MNFKLKSVYVATLIALTTSVSAERMIVTYDTKAKASSLKSSHKVLVEGENWFAVDLDDTAKNSMKSQSGFLKMEVDHIRSPFSLYNDDAGDPNSQQLTPYAIYQSQADQLSLQPGQKVCIIDSGLDQSNNDFDWGNITGDNDSGTGNWFEHGGPHGTHVAGTVGAADNGFGVIGMAPGVSMHIVKVFNEAGWGYSSDLAYAAQKCTNAGANIITMSLGGGGANSTEENAFNTFTNNGGLVLAAAGNDGNNVRSYPAGYKSVMMIGANDANNNIASFSQFPTNTKGKGRRIEVDDGFGVEITAGGVDTFSTYPAGLATISSLVVDGSGVASAATDNTGSVSGSTFFMQTAESTNSGANGKICVIDRGVISFADKINNCANSGGIGAIVVNNEPGVIYMDITGVTTSIPAVGAAQEDRSAIVGSSNASINSGAGDYGYMSGTSMATPGAAGVAALVWSNNPNCTGTEIREALKATAQDQGSAGRDDYFGYGIVKAKDANDYLATQACGGGTPPPPGNIAPNALFTYSCNNLSCSFDGSTSSDSDGSIAAYSWSFGGSNATENHTFASSGSYSVTLTVTDNEGATGSKTQSITVDDGVTPPPADMVLTGSRSKGNRQADLNWTGGNTSNVDVYINGNFNNTIANDGSVSYSVNKNSTYTFQVCEAGSTVECTNQITL
jgi:subtilisin family serine protease